MEETHNYNKAVLVKAGGDVDSQRNDTHNPELPGLSLSPMNKVYLLLGSNEGDRQGWLLKARTSVTECIGTIQRLSSVYETAPWGLSDQPAFLNQVLEISTDMTPDQLLQVVNKIEHQLGRQRTVAWGQRTLDLDILFYNEEIIDTPTLKIPHPQIHNRRFTLVPLTELTPDFIHPVLKKSCKSLLAECPDTLEVKLLTTPATIKPSS